MEPFQIVREVPLPQGEAFARLTDWTAHADVVPFTSMRVTETGFVARTAVGRFGFDDPMEIVAWDPPRFCRLEKRGRVVLGWAEISVVPADGGSTITWREVAHVRGVPRWLGRLERAAGALLFRRVLTALTRT